jgi:hypothetical protein
MNPGERGVQCTNCGQCGHSRQECHIPDMDILLEQLGPDRDKLNAPAAARKKIVSDFYNKGWVRPETSLLSN